MRKSSIWLGLILICVAVLGVQWQWGRRARRAAVERWRSEAELVARLGLTDLCLFNDARYTRHLSQADRHAAFQDGPGTKEHFPSGSLALPLLERGEKE